MGGILELSLPQCPGDAVVWTDGWKRVRRRIRMVGDLKASKTYVAIDDNRLCGRLNVVVIGEKCYLVVVLLLLFCFFVVVVAVVVVVSLFLCCCYCCCCCCCCCRC